MKYNIRNLLWHMKHKGLEGEADKIRECKETLYDATVDNVNFFTVVIICAQTTTSTILFLCLCFAVSLNRLPWTS